MIDSKGKPGIGGRVMGVVTDEDDFTEDLLTVVPVLTEVLADVEVIGVVDVLTTGVEDEIEVDVLTWDDVGVDELEVLWVVVCWPTTGGLAGSKWKMPASGVAAKFTPAPTAQPSVGEVKYTECRAKFDGREPPANDGAIGIAFQPAPLKSARMGFGGGPVPSSPTAQPSPLPDPVPNVSTNTDRSTVVEGAPFTWFAPPLQLTPPLFVVTIVELSPTIHPSFGSLK
jgi:hypothetical protein